MRNHASKYAHDICAISSHNSVVMNETKKNYPPLTYAPNPHKFRTKRQSPCRLTKPPNPKAKISLIMLPTHTPVPKQLVMLVPPTTLTLRMLMSMVPFPFPFPLLHQNLPSPRPLGRIRP